MRHSVVENSSFLGPKEARALPCTASMRCVKNVPSWGLAHDECEASRSPLEKWMALVSRYA